MKNDNLRKYIKEECIVFKKTHESFEGLSNMAAGYPIKLENINILTSEALYQCCRYPHLSNVQKLIISERSPMIAKMVSKKYTKETRVDWNDIRINVMRWVLRVKLLNNFNTFGKLLMTTGNKYIVEESRRDDFWGTKLQSDGTLVGANILGRLLMELREQYVKIDAKAVILKPLNVKDFKLLDNDIPIIRINIQSSNTLILKNKNEQIDFLKD
jgi:type I restriction enzyme S subunit